MVRHHCSRQVRALIDLQLLCCARADELVRMRPVDLDTSGPVWIFQLDDHKMDHQGKEKIIYLGRRAQRIIKMFMTPDRAVDRFLFSPREAEGERHARATAGRTRTPTPRRPTGPSATGTPRYPTGG